MRGKDVDVGENRQPTANKPKANAAKTNQRLDTMAHAGRKATRCEDARSVSHVVHLTMTFDVVSCCANRNEV